MAQGKKCVLLYCDLIHTIEKMDNETAGLFFKHYLRYINDLNPKTDNLVVELTFESVKQNLKRDLLKWEVVRSKRSEAGKKSAKARALKKEQNSTNSTSVKSVKQNSTNPTVNVNDNVNDNVNVNVNDNVNVNVISDDDIIDFADSLHDVDLLKKEYLKNESIIKAVINEPRNKVKNKKDLEKYLDMHCADLKQQGRASEKWSEFTRYFINSLRSGKFTSKVDAYINNKADFSDSNEEIIYFNSNVNPLVIKLPKSRFLKLKEKNSKGGYIYNIIKTESNGN